MRDRRVVTEGFHRRVYAVVRLVPAGAVTTYGDVAAALGARTVARHVGWALAAIPDDVPPVPWHRVLDARGRVAERAGGAASPQRALLEAVGVAFDGRGRVALQRLRHRFDVESVRSALERDHGQTQSAR
jgi:alkylated DNA nucleotide flippase Atl1